jgi:hypothetical protein
MPRCRGRVLQKQCVLHRGHEGPHKAPPLPELLVKSSGFDGQAEIVARLLKQRRWGLQRSLEAWRCMSVRGAVNMPGPIPFAFPDGRPCAVTAEGFFDLLHLKKCGVPRGVRIGQDVTFDPGDLGMGRRRTRHYKELQRGACARAGDEVLSRLQARTCVERMP